MENEVLPTFSLRNVTKRFVLGWRRKVLEATAGISFDIAPGESVGFIGQNGAGKSTTIKIMLGLLRPSEGSALIRGVPALTEAAKKRISYLPERPLLYDYLTPSEHVAMSLRFSGWEKGIAPQRDKWLARFGILADANRQVHGFSKGMSQRVALAMAMCSQPDTLVLDEPLSGLDPIGRKEVVEILDKYRIDGGTLFFSSHVLSDVEKLADRCLLIQNGHIRGSYDTKAILTASSELYDIAFFSYDPIIGYKTTGKNLWSNTLKADEIPSEIARLKSPDVLLHSVRSTVNIEKLYLDLISHHYSTSRPQLSD